MARKLPKTAEQFHENPHVDCANMHCHLPAICRIKIKNAWANLCKIHYDRHFADESNANLDKYGMAKLPDESTKEHVARMPEFVKQGFRKIGRYA